MMVNQKEVESGSTVYSRPMPAIYDIVVLGLLTRLLWRCPASHGLQLYNENVSANHLDVGVGTGYFLDHCRFPTEKPRVALLDLSQSSLAVGARRLKRYEPEVYQVDVLEPIAIECPKFDSIGLTALLHCLPGTIKTKGVSFNHLKALMNPGGVLFGCTVLAKGIKKNWFAQRALKQLNAHKLLSNLEDDLEDLKDELAKHFLESHVKVVGYMAFFRACTPS